MFAIIGLAGSGKGTICRLASEELNAKHIEMGELIRSKIREGTLRNEIKDLIDHGNLIPDKYIFEILDSEIDPGRINLIDGVPRTETQMIELQKRYPDIKVIELSLPKEVALNRLLNRKDNRDDDYEEAIMRRFNAFEREHSKIFNHCNYYHRIDSNRDINEVYEEFESFIN